MRESIPDIWRAGHTERLVQVLADDVIFSSPVADYRGAEAAHIVALVARTLEQIETTRHWDDGEGDAVTAFTARVQGAPVDGVVRERSDAHGVVTHVSLFLRPLHTLQEAITRIRALRRQYPVPARPS